MKKIILALMLTLCLSAKAADNDTIAVNMTKVEKLIVDDTINSKGKKVVKYYVIYNGDLIPTNKTAFEYVALCRKHGVTPKLYLVVKGRNKRIIK